MSTEELRRQCRASDIPFETTAEAPPLPGLDLIGQERAIEALEFGIEMRRDGYNLFAMGPPGVGKRRLLQQLIGKRAQDEKTPSDWCYVHNFDDDRRPLLLELPPGMGCQLQRDMDGAIGELRVGMRSTFSSEEYRTRRNLLVQRFQDRQRDALDEVGARAEERDVAVREADTGIELAPIYQGEVIDFAKFRTLPEDRQTKLEEALEEIGAELQSLLHQFLEWSREHMAELEALGLSMAASAAQQALGAMRDRYEEYPTVLEHLSQVESDAVANADAFLAPRQEPGESSATAADRRGGEVSHYRINVLVDNSRSHGAPVIFEDHPTYVNLMGRIEHESEYGSLVTNFSLIRAGSLHRANGGYLVLDALKLLERPAAWDALKRCMRSGELQMESLAHALGVVPTVSLEPHPVALRDTKVVLVGERLVYYLLSAHDPDFLELFKVLVDFESSMDRESASEALYAQVIAELAGKEGLRAFGRGAVARVIDQSSRLANDSEKLTMHLRSISDLLRESDHWAAKAEQEVVRAEDVQTALDAHRRRSGRMRERMKEAIVRGDILVATEGRRVGQLNGLSVSQIGEHSFGHPTRISARVRVGNGKLVDIEREVDLGGGHPLQGRADPRSLSRRPLRTARAALALGHPGVRAVLRRRRRGQCLASGAVCPPLGPRRCSALAVLCDDRLGESARRGAEHRRGQRQDRGLLRHLQRAGAQR